MDKKIRSVEDLFVYQKAGELSIASIENND